MWEFGRASDEEALRLVLAFLKIMDFERRAEIILMAERYQTESKPPPHRPPYRVQQDNQLATDSS
jgi:hypothetical protein